MLKCPGRNFLRIRRRLKCLLWVLLLICAMHVMAATLGEILRRSGRKKNGESLLVNRHHSCVNNSNNGLKVFKRGKFVVFENYVRWKETGRFFGIVCF